MEQLTYQPLDDLINKSGLKYQFISKELNVSYNYFWKMRVDPRKMNIAQMERLAELLDVSFFEIYAIQKKFREEVDKKTTLSCFYLTM